MTLKIIKNKNEEPKFKPVTVQITFANKDDLRSFLDDWACTRSALLIPHEVFIELYNLLD